MTIDEFVAAAWGLVVDMNAADGLPEWTEPTPAEMHWAASIGLRHYGRITETDYQQFHADCIRYHNKDINNAANLSWILRQYHTNA